MSSGNPETSPLRTKMVLQVHDELLFEVPQDELERVAKLVRHCMEDAYLMCVPVKVDVKVGHNWAEMTQV